jgi:hypothetical protein
MVLSAAGGNNTPVADSTSAQAQQPPLITNTPDPCAPENIEAESWGSKIMREFDDATLAVNLPRRPADAIADLQRIAVMRGR